MVLDVGSIYLAGGLAAVIASGAMYTGNRIAQHVEGVGALTLALLLLGIALAFFGFNAHLGNLLTFGIGNPLLAGSALLFRRAADRIHVAPAGGRMPLFVTGLICLVEWASLTPRSPIEVSASVGAIGSAVALLLPVPALFAGQGRAIGRSGTIDVEVDVVDGAPVQVRVTGDAVIVFRAEIDC